MKLIRRVAELKRIKGAHATSPVKSFLESMFEKVYEVDVGSVTVKCVTKTGFFYLTLKKSHIRKDNNFQ